MDSEKTYYEEYPVNNSKGNIFIVDDDNTIRKIMTKKLNDYGYSILSAKDGRFALKSFERFEKYNKSIDIILLDLIMPEISGIDLFNSIKEDNHFKEIPVIFITASDDLESKIAALEMGAVDYISKMPKIHFEILIPKINTFVKLKKLSDEVNLKNKELDDLNKKLDQKVKERTSELKTVNKELDNLNKRLDQKVKERTFELKIVNKELDITNYINILGFANAAEQYDEFTGKHLERIPRYLEVLAKQMKNGSRNDCRKKDYDCLISELYKYLYHASILHDIGKLSIGSYILSKPSKLTDKEFDIIKTHTSIGEKLLVYMYDEYNKYFNEKKNIYYLAAEIAYTHHEKWDGSGYPQGLKYENIPLSGRLVTLVDSYDAMISLRPYKDPIPHDIVVQNIINDKGKHFDPMIVDIFLSVEDKFLEISEKYSNF